MGSDIGLQSPYIEELEEDVLSPGLSPGSNNWSPPRSESPEPLAQVQEGTGQDSAPDKLVDQVKVILEVETQEVDKPKRRKRLGSQQRRRKQLQQYRALQTQEERKIPADLRTLLPSRKEPTLITRTHTEDQDHLDQPQNQSFYLPYLPPKSPAWEVREALNGRLGLESLHFVALLIRDRIGSSLRFKKYNFAPPN